MMCILVIATAQEKTCKSKEEGKDQESVPSSTTPDSRKGQKHEKTSREAITRLQGTDKTVRQRQTRNTNNKKDLRTP